MIKIKYNDSETLYSVSFSKSKHIITLKGDDIPKNLSGFATYQDDIKIGEFNEFTTMYRRLDNGIQYSDDGSTYIAPDEPTKDIVVRIEWNDSNNADNLRPNQVSLIIDKDEYVEEIILTDDNNWEKVYKNIPITKNYTIVKADNIDKYSKEINGSVITYSHNYIDPIASVTDRLNNVEDAILELYDIIAMIGEE